MAEQKLLRFFDRRAGAEFVVIDTSGMTASELEAEYMAELRDTVVIPGNVNNFPTDRELRDPST